MTITITDDRPKSSLTVLDERDINRPTLTTIYLQHSYPERRRDRPCEASATILKRNGANSGSSGSHTWLPRFWKMRGEFMPTGLFLPEEVFC
jgi:hypothetical protein